MLIDLHTHTAPQSWDSVLSPDELIALAKNAGLDGICLTEHDQFWPLEETERLGKRHGFLVLPGVEITTEEGHLLAFGIDRYVFGMHRASFLKERVERAGGVIVAAHPYRRNFQEELGPWVPPYDQQVRAASANPALGFAAAVEVLNGRGSHRENGFSLDLCHSLGMRATGASDAHEPGDVGACATEVLAPVGDLDDLIRELKAGRFRPVDLRNRRSPSPARR